MDREQGEERVKEIIEDIEGNSPILLLGQATMDFKKHYDKRIDRVSNAEKVKEVVSYYTNLPALRVPLVLDGISFLNKKSIFTLLKLVEEATFPVVLLSKFDKISPIVLSRVKTVLKYQSEKTTSEFLPISEGLEILNDKLDDDSHYFDRLKYINKYSPLIYFIESNLGNVRNKDKILNIIGGERDGR